LIKFIDNLCVWRKDAYSSYKKNLGIECIWSKCV
jgi:hypothetical protein